MAGQTGSSWGGTITLVVVAALCYWQWDRIAGMFSTFPGTGSKDSIRLEVTDFRCERIGGLGDAMMSGNVKNLSGEPLTLAIMVTWRFEGLKPIFHPGYVQPQPVPLGGTGRFELKGPLPPQKGECKIQSFTDAPRNKPVGFRGG